MRWYEILESRLADLHAQYKRDREKLARLQAHRTDSLVKVDSDEADDDRFKRKAALSKKLSNTNSRQIIDLAHEIERLKAEITREKLKGKPLAHFATVSSQKNGYANEYVSELGQAIERADHDLPDPAATAIEDFVGNVAGGQNGAGGMWDERQLEDAYSANPSPEGQEIRQQLEAAFAPIRAMLRAEYGDTVEIYRSQRRLNGDEAHRNVLSWTGNLKMATEWGDEHAQVLTKAIPLEDIIWITDRSNQSEFICRNHAPAR